MKAAASSHSLRFRSAVSLERETIRKLLERVHLPAESLQTGKTTFYVAEKEGAIVGIAGLEFYGEDALLRSVAVPPELQNRGIGDRITDFMISTARDQNIRRMVLLTETARRFFEKKGFRVVDRSSIDNRALKQSSEFTFACPGSAVCMILDLQA